jgi:ATP-dependent Clp protease ATP-binding subunit ClpC
MALIYHVDLFIQQLHSGFSLLTVLGEERVQVLTDDLDRAREEIQLLLSDRLERLHPGRLSRYAPMSHTRTLELVLPDALPVQVSFEEEEHRPLHATALITRDRLWQRLWLPRWDLRYWLPHSVDPEEAMVVILRELLPRLSAHELLELRIQGREVVETLTIDTDRAPLSAFTEKLLGAPILPENLPKADKEQEEDEEDDTLQLPGGKKKKRPPTPHLQRIAIPLSQLARDEELERAHGRERELRELTNLLSAPGASCWVLLGESGVGKSTVLHQLVYRIGQDDAPKTLRKRPVWFVDASRLVAGEGWFGDWQRQCLDVVQEAMDAEIVWYIGDPLALLDAGRSISSDQSVALLLKPFLASRRITVIAESTPRRWSQLEQRDLGFARMFTPYRLSEPEPADARFILNAVAGELREETDLQVTAEGLRAIEELCARFSADSSRLGTALHFLRRLVDDAAARQAEVAAEADPAAKPAKPAPLRRHEVVQHFCAETGMPAFLVQDDAPMDPQAVWAHFRARLIGQDEAVRRMTDLVALIKAGLADLRRPLGSFLFVGPTGVGKTEMAKALTEFIFGRADRMIRYDMSEFIAPDSVHRFIGSGGREGQLISQIRRSPFCVLLLDEIEKAHPAVFDVLLQVLGEARLTDQAGRTADFRNTIVLMTSNLGVDTFRDRPGFAAADAGQRGFREHFEGEARRFFRPELLNRIDFIVPFEPLQRDAIDRITRRELDRFLQREGVRQRRIDLRIDPDVQGWLATHGVDPRYGARPLKRLIERSLTHPLAVHLSERAGHALKVQVEGDQLAFQPLPTSRAQQRSTQESDRFLQRISQVRFCAQRWLHADSTVELDHKVRLLDRLTQDRTFWKDAAWANQRVLEVARPRQLLQELREINEQLASLEDLAFEQHLQRRTDALPLLEADLDAARARLDAAELDLFDVRFQQPDAADLFLQVSQDATGLLREALDAWIALADIHGWTLKLRRAVEDKQLVEAREQRAVERAERAAAAGKQPPPAKERSSNKDDHWRWIDRDVATYKALGEEGEEEWRPNQRRITFLDQAAALPTGTLLHLAVRGPHACLLHAEAGMTLLIEDKTTYQLVVATLDRPATAPLPKPMAARELLPRYRRRVIHTIRRTITDLPLDIQLPWDGHLAKPLQRFSRAALYDAVFGAGAWKMFT